jgi:membrane protease YdiL (CAAX protease family)
MDDETASSSISSSIESPPVRGWRIADALIAFILGISFSSAAVIIYDSIDGPSVGDPLGRVATGLTGLWLGWLGYPLWIAHTKGSGIVAELRLRLGWRDVATGVGVGLLGQAAVWLIYLPFVLLSSSASDKLSEPAEDLSSMGSGGWVVVTFLLLAIAAPLVEEVLFRGVFLRSLRDKWGNVAAVLVSAGLFAIIHQELLQAPGLFVLGVLLAVTTLRTGRLTPSIIGHVTFNSFTLLALSVT